MKRFALLVLFVAPLAARAQNLDVTIANGKHEIDFAPVRVPLQWPKDWKQPEVVHFSLDGKNVGIGQLTEPNFVTDKIKADDGKVRKDLVFIAPKTTSGQISRISIPAPTGAVDDVKRGDFAWKDTPNDRNDLVYRTANATAPVMRYVYKTYDPSTPAARNRTYKVFHHVYDPSGAGKLVTNGGHTDELPNEKDLLFPHHRGLYFGVNKCSYDGKSADTWHCTGDTHVSHVKTLHQTAGPIMAEHRVLLNWHGPKNEVFAEEERQMTVYKVPGGTLIDFTTRLTPKVAKLHLDGDPQHSGFQFRAHNDVAKKTAKETYYLRTDGKGEPGKTINWDAKKPSPATVNVPWKVCSFVLDGKRYSVELIDHPNNPGEKRYSERDYGRFGGYFVADVTPSEPLVLQHRVWLQDGDMTGEQAEKLRQAFVDGPRVTNK